MWSYCIGQHIILVDGLDGFVEYKVSWFIFLNPKGLEHLLKRVCLLFFWIAQGLEVLLMTKLACVCLATKGPAAPVERQFSYVFGYPNVLEVCLMTEDLLVCLFIASHVYLQDHQPVYM